MERTGRYCAPVVKIFVALSACLVLAGFAAAQQAPSAKEQLRLGFSTNLFIGVDKRDVQVALDMWVKELGRSLSISQEPVAVVFSDLNETVESVRKQEVDFVAMSFLDYLKIRPKVDLEPILVGTKSGQVGEKYALVIHRSAPWTEVKQLRNKKLLVQESNGSSAISLLWLDNVLYQQRLPESARFFQPLRMVDKPSQAVLPIFFQQADVCLLPRWAYDTMVELNPQVGSETKILVTSPILPKGALFMRKGVSARKQAIVEDSIRMVETEKSKQLLTLFNSERFTKYQPQFLQTVIDLENSNLSFKKTK
jgi:ABC-type phosphate/phosphonate transport system substrate-binding protein